MNYWAEKNHALLCEDGKLQWHQSITISVMKYLFFFGLLFWGYSYLFANPKNNIYPLKNTIQSNLNALNAKKLIDCDTCYTVQVTKYKSKNAKRKWLSFSQRGLISNKRVIAKYKIYKEDGKEYIVYKKQKFFLNYDSAPKKNEFFCNSFYEKFVDSLSDLVSWNTLQIVFLMLDSTGKIIDHGNCTFRPEKYYSEYIKSSLNELKSQLVFSPAVINNQFVNTVIAVKLSFSDKSCSISDYFRNGIYNYE